MVVPDRFGVRDARVDALRASPVSTELVVLDVSDQNLELADA